MPLPGTGYSNGHGARMVDSSTRSCTKQRCRSDLAVHQQRTLSHMCVKSGLYRIQALSLQRSARWREKTSPASVDTWPIFCLGSLPGKIHLASVFREVPRATAGRRRTPRVALVDVLSSIVLHLPQRKFPQVRILFFTGIPPRCNDSS